MKRILSYEQSLAAVRALAEHRAPKKFLKLGRPEVKVHPAARPWVAPAPECQSWVPDTSGYRNPLNNPPAADCGSRVEVPRDYTGDSLD